jgi:hypothetical protein
MSRLVATAQIAIGMVLDKAIKNKHGQLLIPGGITIEEKHIKLFKTWGISSVYIKGETVDSDYYASNDAQKTEWLEALYGAYGWTPRNRNEDDLFEMVMMLKLDTL